MLCTDAGICPVDQADDQMINQPADRLCIKKITTRPVDGRLINGTANVTVIGYDDIIVVQQRKST